MSFNVNELMGGQVDIEDVEAQSDAEIQAGSTSHHMDFIRRNTNRGGLKHIPDAGEVLTAKKVKEMNKYIIYGVVIYLLCC